MSHGRIVTIQILLRDEPGALSGALNLLAGLGGNVLTINQSVPSEGVAAVTVGMETAGPDADFENVLNALKSNELVIRCEVLAG